jgi:predicted dehydrogenase
VPVALAAVNSGKDVYVEKPLGLSLEECQILRSAIHRKKRIFQFGTQQRSDKNFRIACELVRNGAIGRLQHINVWAPGSAPGGSRKVAPPPSGMDYEKWVGPAAFRPHTENLCSADANLKTWWFVSDFALGFIAGWGIHPMDIAVWGGGSLLDGTATVEGRGNFRAAEGICDTATIWEVDWSFPSDVTLKFVGVPNGGNRGAPTGEPFLYAEEWKQRYGQIASHGTAFEGSDGWVEVHRGGLNVHSEELRQRKEDNFKLQLIRSSSHARNFLDCVRSRGETVCSIDTAMVGETMCHVSDIAIRLGRKLTYDFRKEHFIGDDAANLRLKMRPMRKPWQIS